MRALIILALALTACGGSGASPSPEGRTLTGTFEIHASEGAGFSGACRGTGGFEDIAAGMQMTLRDGDGTVLGADTFSAGQSSDDRERCIFEFSFDDVPDTDFYVLDAGRRGEQTYSFDDLEASDWTVTLEIAP